MKRVSRSDQKRITRFAMWGALSLGLVGFVVGVVICLYYRLPIPPLFITELGLILGGCGGALCAIAGSERKVFATLAAIFGTLLICGGLKLGWLHSSLALLVAGTFAWAVAEPPGEESGPWRKP